MSIYTGRSLEALFSFGGCGLSVFPLPFSCVFLQLSPPTLVRMGSQNPTIQWMKTETQAGEATPQLRTCTVLAEDPSSVPKQRSHISA